MRRVGELIASGAGTPVSADNPSASGSLAGLHASPHTGQGGSLVAVLKTSRRAGLTANAEPRTPGGERPSPLSGSARRCYARTKGPVHTYCGESVSSRSSPAVPRLRGRLPSRRRAHPRRRTRTRAAAHSGNAERTAVGCGETCAHSSSARKARGIVAGLTLTALRTTTFSSASDGFLRRRRACERPKTTMSAWVRRKVVLQRRRYQRHRGLYSDRGRRTERDSSSSIRARVIAGRRVAPTRRGALRVPDRPAMGGPYFGPLIRFL